MVMLMQTLIAKRRDEESVFHELDFGGREGWKSERVEREWRGRGLGMRRRR